MTANEDGKMRMGKPPALRPSDVPQPLLFLAFGGPKSHSQPAGSEGVCGTV